MPHHASSTRFASAGYQTRATQFPSCGTRSRCGRERYAGGEPCLYLSRIPWVEATWAKSVTLAQPMGLAVGQRLTWERTFTEDDVRQFAEVSGDRGAHHVQPGPDGRVMVQGLLTATLPTKIGGDLSFMAREMTFEFVRPVFSGDAVTTEVTVLSVEPEGSRE